MPTKTGERPLRVIASNGFGLSPAGWWLLEIRDDGAATLTGHERQERRFSIPASGMAELRAALAACDLESLSQHHHGTPVIDAQRCTLLVMRGDEMHSISLSRFRYTAPTDVDRREARRALELWTAVKRSAGVLELRDVCSDMLVRREPSKGMNLPKVAPAERTAAFAGYARHSD